MTVEQAMELDRQQHDHANATANASAVASSRTEDAHYDAAYGFYLDHGFWPVNDEDLAGY